MKKEGWKYCKLGDVGTFQRGGNFKKADFVENGFPCIHYGQIHTTFGVSTETHLSSVPIDLVKKEKCAKKGDLIIAITSEDEECSCKCTAWLGDYDVYVGGHTAIFRHNLNPVFMSYYFRSSQFNKLKLEYTHGFKVVEINPKDIAKIPIAYPDSLFDQQKIVEYLDSTFEKIDKIKEDAEKKIAEAKLLFQATLNEKLKMRDGWKEKTIGEIQTNMYRGSGIKRDQIIQEGYPCIRYGEIYTTYNYFFSECVSHTNESIIKPKKYFEKGDILFAITGESVEDIGKCIAYTGDEKCLLGGDIVVMKHDQNPKYLSYALSTTDAIRQKGKGKTKLKVVHTNIPSLKIIVIPIPSLAEQQQIVTELDSLSEKTKAIEEKCRQIITECDILKQAILKQVFE